MAEITASLVKELRDKTQAGMLDCKKALMESDGDIEKATEFLRKKGLAAANKRADRDAKEGIVLIKLKNNNRSGIMVELNCETDFVAKNQDFKDLGEKILAMVEEAGPSCTSLENLPSEVEELVKAQIAKTGENTAVGGCAQLHIADGIEGAIATYIHSNQKIGIMVELHCEKAESIQQDVFKTLGSDIAMQVAAANPQWLVSEEVPEDVKAKEKDIFMEQMRNSGKPENVLEKIVEGKLRKFYSEVCLLEQEFIKEPKKSVKELIQETNKALGDTISVAKIVRFHIGA